MKRLAVTIFGLMTVAVTLLGYPLWLEPRMMLLPTVLWVAFLAFAVHALKPQ